jgi:hypothetical protein
MALPLLDVAFSLAFVQQVLVAGGRVHRLGLLLSEGGEPDEFLVAGSGAATNSAAVGGWMRTFWSW